MDKTLPCAITLLSGKKLESSSRLYWRTKISPALLLRWQICSTTPWCSSMSRMWRWKRFLKSFERDFRSLVSMRRAAGHLRIKAEIHLSGSGNFSCSFLSCILTYRFIIFHMWRDGNIYMYADFTVSQGQSVGC